VHVSVSGAWKRWEKFALMVPLKRVMVGVWGRSSSGAKACNLPAMPPVTSVVCAPVAMRASRASRSVMLSMCVASGVVCGSALNNPSVSLASAMWWVSK